jgi:hypothetical protein
MITGSPERRSRGSPAGGFVPALRLLIGDHSSPAMTSLTWLWLPIVGSRVRNSGLNYITYILELLNQNVPYNYKISRTSEYLRKSPVTGYPRVTRSTATLHHLYRGITCNKNQYYLLAFYLVTHLFNILSRSTVFTLAMCGSCCLVKMGPHRITDIWKVHYIENGHEWLTLVTHPN